LPDLLLRLSAKARTQSDIDGFFPHFLCMGRADLGEFADHFLGLGLFEWPFY
jgi:hypothetical protein